MLKKVSHISARLSGCFHLVTSMPTYAALSPAQVGFFVEERSVNHNAQTKPAAWGEVAWDTQSP